MSWEGDIVRLLREEDESNPVIGELSDTLRNIKILVDAQFSEGWNRVELLQLLRERLIPRIIAENMQFNHICGDCQNVRELETTWWCTHHRVDVPDDDTCEYFKPIKGEQDD